MFIARALFAAFAVTSASCGSGDPVSPAPMEVQRPAGPQSTEDPEKALGPGADDVPSSMNSFPIPTTSASPVVAPPPLLATGEDAWRAVMAAVFANSPKNYHEALKRRLNARITFGIPTTPKKCDPDGRHCLWTVDVDVQDFVMRSMPSFWDVFTIDGDTGIITSGSQSMEQWAADFSKEHPIL